LRFSVVLMTHQRPAELRRCLESLTRQTWAAADFEVIVVDDGSLRGPPVPLQQLYPGLQLRYGWKPHEGVAAARNAGLAFARAELVAFLADDYVVPPDYLSRAARFFQDYPDAQVLTFNVRSVGRGLGCQVQQLYHELVLLQNAAALPDRNGIIRSFHLPASRGAIFRRELLLRVGGFDRRLRAGEDGELGRRLASLGIPLHFMVRYAIDHHEARGFRGFLQQRRAYATSQFAVVESGRLAPDAPTWTLRHCIRLVALRLGEWAALSRREGKLLRFVCLWPGLALFLFRFVLTLRELERASRVQARGGLTLSPPSPAGTDLLSRLRLTLHAATRYRVVRAPTLAAIQALTRLSTGLLAGVGGVAAIYARGSYARGDFRPFISDIDIALAIKAPAGQAYAHCRRLGRRLALVRWLNPCLRDRWQTILTAPQWPLVARYGPLLGLESWRLLHGAPPWGEPELVVEPRLEAAAWWNRQRFWTETAIHQALRQQTAIRELPASLKKARQFAARLGTPFAAPPSPGAALVDLDRSAARLIRDHQLNAHWRPAAERLGTAMGSPQQRRALAAVELAIDLDRDGATVLATDDWLYLISARELSETEYRLRIAALTEVHRDTGVPVFPCSAAAFALALITRRLGILRAGELLRGPANEAEPLLLCEQLLYQSLYLGTHLWVVAGRSTPGPGLERHVAAALEACAYFATGTLWADPPDLPLLLGQFAALDHELSRRLPLLPSGQPPTPPQLFEIGTIAVERLCALLCDGGGRLSR
jgi:GT2 family glycosyltransferase/predicted nucleotidyltransferase